MYVRFAALQAEQELLLLLHCLQAELEPLLLLRRLHP